MADLWLAKFWYRHSPSQTAHLTIPLDPAVDLMVQRFHPRWLFGMNGKTYDRAFIEGEIEFESRNTEQPVINEIDPTKTKWPGL